MWKPTWQFLNDLTYRKVQVTTNDKTEHVGWVYTADPVSSTIALIDFAEENRLSAKNLRLIPGSSIIDIRIFDDVCDEGKKKSIDQIISIDRADQLVGDRKSIDDRKAKTKRWLIKNRIPIDETEESIRVLDVLDIRSPFDVDNCFCTNEVILARVRKLLESMPNDF